jgi:hypothetical protein
MGKYLKKIRAEQWFLIGWLVLFLAMALVPLSVSAKEADHLPEPALPEKIDPHMLLAQMPHGVRFDPKEASWTFYGIPYEAVQYEMPGGVVDLVHVYFLDQNGVSRQVWVSLGVDLVYRKPLRYISRGPWESSEEAWQQVRLNETVLKVSIRDTEGKPRVSQTGVDWSSCQYDSCYYGYFFDRVNANGLSNQFIATGHAPSWYPWGFLFWDLEVVAGQEGFEQQFSQQFDVK